MAFYPRGKGAKHMSKADGKYESKVRGIRYRPTHPKLIANLESIQSLNGQD